ncbi:hypothetical protein ACOMHN_062926 [Nucella lapillus]
MDWPSLFLALSFVSFTEAIAPSSQAVTSCEGTEVALHCSHGQWLHVTRATFQPAMGGVCGVEEDSVECNDDIVTPDVAAM